MGKRREAREAAVQFLFERDMHGAGHKMELDYFWTMRPSTTKVREFATDLINGVLTNQKTIDDRIKKFLQNYELKRVAAVDRNVLRLGIYEMLFCNDIPPVVSINEAIEIAKRFGSE